MRGDKEWRRELTWEDKEMKEMIKMRKEERKGTYESIRGEDESEEEKMGE